MLLNGRARTPGGTRTTAWEPMQRKWDSPEPPFEADNEEGVCEGNGQTEHLTAPGVLGQSSWTRQQRDRGPAAQDGVAVGLHPKRVGPPEGAPAGVSVTEERWGHTERARG